MAAGRGDNDHAEEAPPRRAKAISFGLIGTLHRHYIRAHFRHLYTRCRETVERERPTEKLTIVR